VVHCPGGCAPRSPRSPLRRACNRSVTSPISAYNWPSSPGARGRICATRIPQRGRPTALEDPVSPSRNKSNSDARGRRCRRPAPKAWGMYQIWLLQNGTTIDASAPSQRTLASTRRIHPHGGLRHCGTLRHSDCACRPTPSCVKASRASDCGSPHRKLKPSHCALFAVAKRSTFRGARPGSCLLKDLRIQLPIVVVPQPAQPVGERTFR
jgi:hypothetical protein